MTGKTKAQKAAKKVARKNNAKIPRKPPKQKSKGRSKGGPMGGIPKSMSMVSDGINTGMVWKNTNSVKDFFGSRFEKVTDLVAPGTAFTIIKQFYLNPGNSVLFPVFSQIASTYEEYICHLLRFYYRGETYTAVNSTSAGVVAYATNMDPDDSVFTNIDQLENYEGSVSGPPFTGHFMHDVQEVHKARGRNRSGGAQMALNQYFVFSSANQSAPIGGQAKFYDLGLFQVASNNTSSALSGTVLGELWVEHSWTLIRRKQQTPLGQNALYAHIIEGPLASAAAAGSAFLGTTGGTLVTGSTLPSVAAKATFTMPVAGTFVVMLVAVGSVTVAATFTKGANIVATPTILTDSSVNSQSSVTGGTLVSVSVLTVTAPGTGTDNTVTISGLTSLAAGKVDIFITQISGGALMSLQKSRFSQELLAALDERIAMFEPWKFRSSASSCTPGKLDVSEPDTPYDECKEADLQKSVHLSRSTAEQLLRGLGLGK